MRSTSTDKTTNPKQRRAIRLAASALAVTATLAGGSALADHRGYGHTHYDHDSKRYSYDSHRHASYRHVEQKVRVKIPVRDHGPETLPIGRLIRQNSDIDLDRYRLVAVVTRNGKFSNGFARLRTGNSKSERYFLGSRAKTRIPAPSRADGKWRLRLGPGTQVRSVTAVLEPRRGWAHRQPGNWQHAGSHNRHSHQAAQGASWANLVWLLANADDNDRERKQARRLKKLRAEQARTEAELAETQRKLDRSRERNKRLKHQRERLAEELAYEKVEAQPDKRDRKRAEKRERRSGGERRNAAYVIASH